MVVTKSDCAVVVIRCVYKLYPKAQSHSAEERAHSGPQKEGSYCPAILYRGLSRSLVPGHKLVKAASLGIVPRFHVSILPLKRDRRLH